MNGIVLLDAGPLGMISKQPATLVEFEPNQLQVQLSKPDLILESSAARATR